MFSPTAAAGKMTRSRTKGYVVRFSEFVQYLRRLEGTSGHDALVESWSEHMRQHARLTEADAPPKMKYGLSTSARERLWFPILSPTIRQRSMKGEATM
jgi:hypothetical protein